MLSTLLYASESWTLYSRQEWSFPHALSPRILGIAWQDHVTNNEVLQQAKIQSMTTVLCQRRLRLLGHVRRLKDGRIPKDILYSEQAKGKRTTGRPHLRYKDVCKRDLKAIGIDINSWEELAGDRYRWRQALTAGLEAGERNLQQVADINRLKRKRRANQPNTNTIFQCQKCSKGCHSRVGLYRPQ